MNDVKGNLIKKLRQTADTLDIVNASVLPVVVTESGKDEEPVVETIICDSMSGGADYRNNMPRMLTLVRKLADGTKYRRTYIQKAEADE